MQTDTTNMGARSGRAIKRADLPSWITVDEKGRVWTTRGRGPGVHAKPCAPRRADTAKIDGYRVVTINKRIYRAHRIQHGNRPDRRGEKHPLAKLTPEIVREMRRLYAEGVSRVEIATRFGHSYSHTGEIIARRAWTNVA